MTVRLRRPALEAAPVAYPMPWRFYHLRAMLLLAVGRTDEALAGFELACATTGFTLHLGAYCRATLVRWRPPWALRMAGAI